MYLRGIRLRRSQERLPAEEWQAAVQEKRLKSVKFEVYPGLEMSGKSRKADDWELVDGKLRVVIGATKFVFRPSLDSYAVKELCGAKWLGPLVMETQNGVTYGKILYERVPVPAATVKESVERAVGQQLSIPMSTRAGQEGHGIGAVARVTFGPEHITFSREARELLPEYVAIMGHDGAGMVRIVPVRQDEVTRYQRVHKVWKAVSVQVWYGRIRDDVVRWFGVDDLKKLRKLPMTREPDGTFVVRVPRSDEHVQGGSRQMEQVHQVQQVQESPGVEHPKLLQSAGNGAALASVVEWQRERIRWLMDVERAQGKYMPQVSDEIRLLVELEQKYSRAQ